MKDSKQDRENWYSSLSNVPSHTYKGKQKVTRPYRGMTSSKINKQHYCASLLHITPEGKQTLQKYKSMVLLMDFTGRPFTVALYSDKLPMKYYTKQWKYCTKQWLKKKKKKLGPANAVSLSYSGPSTLFSGLPCPFAFDLCKCTTIQQLLMLFIAIQPDCLKNQTYFCIFFSTTRFCVSRTSKIKVKAHPLKDF